MNELDGAAKKSNPETAAPQIDSAGSANPDPKATLDISAASGIAAASGTATSTGPQSIGPYRLIRKLGEGGMGQVWLAEQIAPVRRMVALKLVKAGMDTEEVVLRFESERQALAMMEHPAIARVYDAGSTPDQHPYFVMELVDGVPITKYCDQHRLSLRARIALFIQVCEGVQHAHQKAIIHRDLKPSNVLVTEQDGKAMPKIIDFGLAKAMGQNLTDVTMFTQVGMVVGTPVYMSPEQAGPQAVDLDTRTDVYSLGVIFYELLVDTTPIEEPSSLAWDQLLRVVRERDAPRPSSRIHKFDAETQSSLAENRSSQPAALRRQLSGDLDWISLKALEKDRERRYNSPFEFAADLHRYLNNEPVIARPPSTAYRWGKFVRRHRLGVGFAASVAALLVAFAIMMAIQAVRLSRERDFAEKNRAEATKQAQLALDTIYLVVTKADDQLRNIAGTGALRKELIQGAMKNLDQISRNASTANWADRTMGVALQRMGDFYYQMGMTTEQIKVENQALTIFRRLSKEQPGEQWVPWNIAVSLDKLGGIARQEEPTPTSALNDFQESLKLREQLVQDVHQPQPPLFRRRIAVGVSANKLADFYLELGDPANALKYARESLDAFVAATNSGASAKERTQFLGAGYYALGRASLSVNGESSAREALNRSVEVRREGVESDALDARAKSDLQLSYVAIGDMEQQLGRPRAAMEQYEKAAQILEILLQKDATDEEVQWNMANVQYAMGVSLRMLAQQQEARSHFERCLKLRQGLLQTEPNSTQTQTEVMLAQAQLGHDDLAIPIAKQLREAAPNHPARLYSVARAYGLCASALAADNISQKSQKGRLELEKEYANSAVQALREAVATGYRNRWTLEHDPDLQSIRNAEGFKRLLEEARW